MTADELTAFRARLSMAMTEIDRKECERESRRGRPNLFRLGILLGAVSATADNIRDGWEPAKAFAGNFTPTKENHKAAQTLGLPLDVQRGRWVLTN